MDLSEKTLVVTGGSGTLGRALVQAARSYGANVVSLDLSPPAETAGFRSIALDLTDVAAVQKTLSNIGRIDVLCNIAGAFAMGAAAHDPDDRQWDAMFRANVGTLRAAIKATVPGMIERNAGRIINVGASSALQGKAGMSAYTAAKAVVMNLTESLAAELAGTPIRVNAVLPTMIDTPANRTDMPDADFTQWVSPEHIAQVICFLAGDLSQAIHGALIPVAGAKGIATR